VTRTIDHPHSPHRSTRRDCIWLAAWFVALSAVYWLGVLALCGRAGFPLDDSFIHLQFARNLFTDGQMAFNRGVPSGGCTAPLYAALVAGVYAIVRDWIAAGIVLGSVCGLATAWVVYGILLNWTGRRALARWGGLLAVVVNPTIVAAGSGMETPVYTVMFLLGLWLYSLPRRRLAASIVFALCIWLRPEFLTLAPMIGLERLLTLRGGHTRGWRAVAGELLAHAAVWAVIVLLYLGYNWHQDRHLLPTTFAAKAIAMQRLLPWAPKGLPAAIENGVALQILTALTLWPFLALLLTRIGLVVNCAPLGIGLGSALRAAWTKISSAAPGRRLAIIALIGYPLLRGMVDPMAPFWYQFQRYYAHLTPLMILIVLDALPATRSVLGGKRWHWRGVSWRRQCRRTLWWAAPFLVVRGAMAVIAVSNINSMQVHIGRWVEANTKPGELVACNDIGAIRFYGKRPILDTVGLVEPAIVEHFLRYRSLEEYLAQRKPAYVIVFPSWYPGLGDREDMLKPVFSVKLALNVICGGPEMVVYRTRWADTQDDDRSVP
jgi:hypothetical protein